jgi:predicted enzyme related to lactoylglutathione lyase
MPNPVVHFEVLGSDAAGLATFYRETFGWETEDLNMPEGGYHMARPNAEGGINGGIGAAPNGGGGHVTFYIAVDDLGAALQKVEAAGGKTIQPPMDIPNGPSIALFADPEDHVIGLVKM